MISSFKVRLSRCCGGIGCPLVPGEEGILERRIPWAGDGVTGTGKKLELGLGFSYFGSERDSPGSSARGEPMGEVREKRPGGGWVARRKGVSGNAGRREEDGPGWLHQRAQNGSPSDHQLAA